VSGRLEFFVEPFTEGELGPHVRAAITAVEGQGLEVMIGPFNNVARGDPAALITAATDLLSAALASGATRISLQISLGEESHELGLPRLQDALAMMIGQVEEALGGPLAELPREAKQAAVRMLDERGAFLLRRAVDDVADSMGVSRITIYNYLNAARDGR
jgi:uncharacterized protein YqgV (UPF0045/DUF77 family)